MQTHQDFRRGKSAGEDWNNNVQEDSDAHLLNKLLCNCTRHLVAKFTKYNTTIILSVCIYLAKVIQVEHCSYQCCHENQLQYLSRSGKSWLCFSFLRATVPTFLSIS